MQTGGAGVGTGYVTVCGEAATNICYVASLLQLEMYSLFSLLS